GGGGRGERASPAGDRRDPGGRRDQGLAPESADVDPVACARLVARADPDGAAPRRELIVAPDPSPAVAVPVVVAADPEVSGPRKDADSLDDRRRGRFGHDDLSQI